MLRELSTDDAFNLFKRHLSSEKNLDTFLESEYTKNKNITKTEKEKIKTQAKEKILILNPKEQELKNIEINLENKNPEEAENRASTFINLAIQSSHEETIQTLKSAIELHLKINELKIETLRESAEKNRISEIERIKNAYQQAKKIDLESPAMGGNLITSYSGENMYLRGYKALEAELVILKNRKSNDPYIKSLPTLLSQNKTLNKLDATLIRGRLVNIDSSPTAPTTPYKPNILICIIIGVGIGILLSILFIITTISYKRYKDLNKEI